MIVRYVTQRSEVLIFGISQGPIPSMSPMSKTSGAPWSGITELNCSPYPAFGRWTTSVERRRISCHPCGMSATKRLLFDRNPLDDAARERLREQTSSYLSEFSHRIAMKRRAVTGVRYWDPLWPTSLEQAARELKTDVVRINDGMFTREINERDALRSRAEAIWRSKRSDRP